MTDQAKMLPIRELRIKGIRSFGPKDEQKITFDTPLTLILGSNGSGKTTIIECLKYITTNPDTNKSKILIHHPQVAQEKTVIGQVHLDLTTMDGGRMTVERSMKGTNQGTKEMTATTLDSCIISGNGNRKSVKGAELEQEIVTALGVSKPVLDNVIFCHQEDSCWPLSESSDLKKKFDAIFNSERYNTALKNILDVKKEKEKTLKKCQDDIKLFKKYKEEAAQTGEALGKQEELLDKTIKEKKELEKELAGINKEITASEEREKEKQKKQQTLEVKQTLKTEKETSIEKLKDKMGQVLEGTAEELKERQEDSAHKIQECKNTMEKFERDSKEAAAKQETLNREKSSLLIDVGKLKQEAETHEKNVGERNTNVCDWATKYGFEGFEPGSITDEKCDTCLEKIKQELDTMGKELDKKEEGFQKEKDDLQVEIQSANKRKRELEQRYKGEQKEDIDQIKQKLSGMKASPEQLPLLNERLQKAEKDLHMAERADVLDDLKREITRLDQEQRQLDDNMSKLNSEKNRLTMLEEIHQIKARHEKALTDLPGSGADVSVGKQRSDCMSEQSKRKEYKVKGQEKREAAVSGNQTFDNCLQDAWKTLSDVQEERGSLLGKKHFLQEYLDDLSGGTPVCHFCRRNFENSSEAELKADLENQLQQLIGTKLPKTEKELANHKKRYEDIVQLQPIRKKLVTIQEQGLPDLQSRQEIISEDIRHLKDWIEKKQGELTPETSESMGREMQPGIVLIDVYQEELRKMDEKMAVHSGGDSARTLEMVDKEEKDLQKKLDAVDQELKEKLQTSDPLGRSEKLRNLVRKLKEEKSNIEEELQHRTKLDETQKALEELSSLEVQLKEYHSKKEEVMKNRTELLKADRDAIEEMKEWERNIAKINKDIRQYQKRNGQEKLEEKQKDLEKLEGEETEEKNNRDKRKAEVDKAKDDLAHLQNYARELLDNQDLREHQKCVGELDNEISKLKQELIDLDPKNLERELKTQKERKKELNDELLAVQVRQKEHETWSEAHRTKLQLADYRNATEEYRKKAIELKTTELVIADLKKYYQALDRAIMDYHTQKMGEINQIIKEIWKNTYCGNDIEEIKIRSNPDGGQETRKKYDYCVVMVQGGAELEMRRRCSAGQKMLASIIIRLALAETFCMNCSVIALDEPTTNLDRENFKSLADALKGIMEARQGRNFQLLVITHSIDFAELLSHAEMTEFVWKVFKDEKGNSKIERRPIQELE